MKKLFFILIMSLRIVSAMNLNSNLVNINGHQIHYYQAGNSGSAIVLLTGYATTSNFWNKEFIQCLAQNHQVFLFDYQGINTHDKSDLTGLSINSMAKDVNALTKKLKLKNPQLLGWSMGGAIALEASFLSPQLYKQLYLLAPVVPNRGQSKLSFPMPEHPPFKSDSDVMSYVFNNNLYDYQPDNVSTLSNNFIQNGLEQVFPNKPVREAQSKAIANWVSSVKSDAQFRQATAPAVFYIPDHDQIINQTVALPIILQYPNATVIQVKNSGHAVAWQIPQQLCKSIDDN
jgi:pimeloyl-ACP methyl ester carboxylesterase